MSEHREITIECYEKLKKLYIDEGFILYEFPIYYIPEVHVASVTFRDFAFRVMDVVTPPELDESIWEYVDNWPYGTWGEGDDE
jgi:hypothetical protein